MSNMVQNRPEQKENPLGAMPIGKLLVMFAVPSIIAMLVSSLYNLVDQYFIGHSVGALGNAATNVAFPLTLACGSCSVLFGVGGAAAFNLAMGAKQKEDAVNYLGNALSSLFVIGCALAVFTEIFLRPMLRVFGTPDDVMQYAVTYLGITAIGFPMLILGTGGGYLVRADGSPKMSMLCNVVGAITNVILDAIFVFGMNMGIAGAAIATVIAQFVSGSMVIIYMRHCKSVQLKKEHLIPKKQYVGKVASLGFGSAINQCAVMIVQIVLNKSLTYYGSMSVYGASTPLACAGIISKVNQLYLATIVGIAQGMQPIVSFNYGSKQYIRVRKCLQLAMSAGAVFSVLSFIAFQLVPRQIIGIFGEGTEEYFKFAVYFFRIFLFFTFVNFIQPVSTVFFTAIGKPIRGMLLAFTRQIVFLLPLFVVLPLFFGIDGILYAGPIADCLACIFCIVMIYLELRDKKYWEIVMLE